MPVLTLLAQPHTGDGSSAGRQQGVHEGGRGGAHHRAGAFSCVLGMCTVPAQALTTVRPQSLSRAFAQAREQLTRSLLK